MQPAAHARRYLARGISRTHGENERKNGRERKGKTLKPVVVAVELVLAALSARPIDIPLTVIMIIAIIIKDNWSIAGHATLRDQADATAFRETQPRTEMQLRVRMRMRSDARACRCRGDHADRNLRSSVRVQTGPFGKEINLIIDFVADSKEKNL